MSTDENSWGRARSGIVVSYRSGTGLLAAAVHFRRVPGVRFGPYPGDEFPVVLCICLWLMLSFIAYLVFF